MFLAFALRCNKEGHYTRLCIAHNKENKQRSKIGDGLVEKIEREEWQRHINWADLIIPSNNVKWIRELDVLKRRGYPVFGPSLASAELELDRAKGQDLLHQLGYNVMEYEEFSDYPKAIKYVHANPTKRLVSKPMGDTDKALSYVSCDAGDMAFMLERWSNTNKLKDGFMLQEFTPGVEMAVSGWMGENGFAEYISESFEHKKLMNDEKGPNTGEMGTALKYMRMSESKLGQEMLLPIEKHLKKLKHTGHVDISVIVDEDGSPRPLEFTCRLGWPQTNLQTVLHPDPCVWMSDLIDGRDTLTPITQHCVGIVMAMPWFPYPRPISKEDEGFPIYGLNDENEYRALIAPCFLMQGEAPVFDGEKIENKKVFVSADNYLLVAHGVAPTLSKAKDRAYKTLESVQLCNSPLYRTDISDRLKEELPILQSHGYAKEWTW